MVSLSEEKIAMLTWIVRGVTAVAVAMTSWFLLQAWDKINKNTNDITELKIDASKVSGSRFTSNDWVLNKTILDNERLAMDRRLIRLEESLPVIKESLIEIKKSIEQRQ